MFPPAATIIVTLRIPFSFNTPTWDVCSPFFLLVSPTAISVLPLFLFSHNPFTHHIPLTSFYTISVPSNPRLIFFPKLFCFPHEPPSAEHAARLG